MVVPTALIFLAVMFSIDVIFFLRWKSYRRRMAAMTLVMIFFGTFWTIGEVIAGTRWIEVAGNTTDTYQKASMAGQFFWLGFDVVIEIALAYVPFFAIPVMIGKIDPVDKQREFCGNP